MFGTSLAFWASQADEAVPLDVLSSGIAGTNTDSASTAISDSIVVPANTTLLVVVASASAGGGVLNRHFDNPAFNSAPMTEVISMDANSEIAAPGLQFLVLENPDIGTFNFTADRSGTMLADFRLFACIGGTLHGTPISDTDAPAVTTSNVDPRSSTVDVAANGSLIIAAAVSQGADTDPFAGGDILDATPLQTGDTGGGSTSGDLGFALFSGAVDAGAGQTYTSNATAADGGTIGAIVIRPAA